MYVSRGLIVTPAVMGARHELTDIGSMRSWCVVIRAASVRISQQYTYDLALYEINTRILSVIAHGEDFYM